MSIISPSLGLLQIPPLAAGTFHEWERQALSVAIGCHPDRPDGTGLAGLFLPARAFAQLDGAEHPFRLLPHPGDAKDTAGTSRLKAYADERRALSAFRTALFGSIPDGVLAGTPGFDHGALGHRAIEIPRLLQHLRLLFGAPTLERYQVALAALEEPQGARTFEELAGDHARHHAMADACGQPMSDLQKIRAFLASLPPATRDIAQRTYHGYAKGEADVSAHRFDPLVATLRTALRAAADTAVETHGGDLSPIALTTKVRPPATGGSDPILDALKDLTVRVDRLTTQGRREQSVLSSEAALSRKRPNKGERYCWTHGVGTHASQECRNPAKGHQKGATLHDRRGGSTRAGR